MRARGSRLSVKTGALAGVATIVAMSLVASAHAAPRGALVPADARVGGRSYAQWERAWVKWRLRLPVHAAPSEGTCINRHQHAPVWFLDGDGAQPNRVTRRCRIPAARYLLLGPWVICTTIATDPRSRASSAPGLRRCARRVYTHAFRGYTLIVDGEPLHPSARHTATGAFRFRMPARENMLALPGRTHGRAAVVADAALLTPLDAGRHTLRVIERYAGGFTRRVTYRVRVA